MIYLFLGNKEARKKEIRARAQGRDLKVQHIYDHDIATTPLSQKVVTQSGLFGERECYVLHSLARHIHLDDVLPDYQKSDNIIIFSEDSLTKPLLKKFEGLTQETKDFGKEIPTKKFLPFPLADAFWSRNKKEAWLRYQEAAKHLSAEEIHGTLVWQLKNVALAKTSSTNPGMTPFQYKKAQGFAAKFRLDEIIDLHTRFVHIFHQRDSASALGDEIEKIILTL